jgi:hypothetical protein
MSVLRSRMAAAALNRLLGTVDVTDGDTPNVRSSGSKRTLLPRSAQVLFRVEGELIGQRTDRLLRKFGVL